MRYAQEKTIADYVYTTRPLRIILMVLALWWLCNLIGRYMEWWPSPAMDYLFKHVDPMVIIPIWVGVVALHIPTLLSPRDAAPFHFLTAVIWAINGIFIWSSGYMIVTQIAFLAMGIAGWAFLRAKADPTQFRRRVTDR